LLDAVEGVTEKQARWKPPADRWTVLEYVEHLAVSDDALVDLVRRSLESPPQVETEDERRIREKKIRETPIPRGVNRAPDHLRPAGRFASLDEAMSCFLAARVRTIEYASNTQSGTTAADGWFSVRAVILGAGVRSGCPPQSSIAARTRTERRGDA